MSPRAHLLKSPCHSLPHNLVVPYFQSPLVFSLNLNNICFAPRFLLISISFLVILTFPEILCLIAFRYSIHAFHFNQATITCILHNSIDFHTNQSILSHKFHILAYVSRHSFLICIKIERNEQKLIPATNYKQYLFIIKRDDLLFKNFTLFY